LYLKNAAFEGHYLKGSTLIMNTVNEIIVFSDDETIPTPRWADVCDLQFPFGKWKGETFHTLVTQPGGRSYFRWLIKNCDLLPLTRGRVNTALAWYTSKKSLRTPGPVRRTKSKRRHNPMGAKRTTRKIKRMLAAPDDITADTDTDASTEEFNTTSITIDGLPTSMPKLTRESTSTRGGDVSE